MSAALGSISLSGPLHLQAWRAPVGLLLGLAGVVVGRWLAVREGADGLLVGVAFGIGLLVLAGVGGFRVPARGHVQIAVRRWRPGAALGTVVGLVLVVVAVAGPALGGFSAVPGLGRPAAPFGSWAAITILVATAEELVLRGVLFRAVRRSGGVGVAIAVTSIAFALLHVPLYGWHVVPLDLAVGLALGGLRVATGTVAAPAAAHLVADLATWWL